MGYENGSERRGRWGANGAAATSEEVEDLTGRIARNVYKLGADVNLIKKLVAKLGKAEGAAASELEAELYVGRGSSAHVLHARWVGVDERGGILSAIWTWAFYLVRRPSLCGE